MKRMIAVCLLLAGCDNLQPVVDKAADIEHAKYQAAELILCRSISIGEWARSIEPYPAKVAAWRALCTEAGSVK